ncbi:MAG: hypothetical protein NZM43_09095 [Saprospiraceae bacterium]|nr:hypothetical protein [Saprospiraceae bacterium]MDW8484469.1 hypothetical protein [Saprospiraceae bacterium]
MGRVIRNLKELAAEKALLRAKMRIAREELYASAQRTRDTLVRYAEQQLEIPHQIGQLLKEEVQQSAGMTLLRTILQALGVSRRWSNLVLLVTPVAMSYLRQLWIQRTRDKANERSLR